MSSRRTLKGQTRLLLVASAAIALFSIVTIVTAEFAAARAELELEVGTAVALLQSRYERHARDTRDRLQILARLVDRNDLEGCVQQVSRSKALFPEYLTIFVVFEDGVTMCHSDIPLGEEGPSAIETSWWGAAWTGGPGALTTSGPEIGGYTGEWAISHNYPVRNEDGVQIATIGVAVDAFHFQRLMPFEYIATDLTLSVLDTARVVVARSFDMEGAIGTRVASEGPPGRTERTDRLGRPLTLTSLEGDPGTWIGESVTLLPWEVWAGLPNRRIRAQVLANAAPDAALIFLLFTLFSLVVLRLMVDVDRGVSGLLGWIDRRLEEPDADTPADSRLIEITELTRAFEGTLAARDEALASERKARIRTESIVENAVLGIYVAAPEGGILNANQALATMLGFDDESELVGRDVGEFYVSSEQRREIRRKAAAGEATWAEAEWRGNDARRFPVRLSWAIMSTSDGPLWEVIVDDLSEKRDLEEQLRHSQKMEAVGRMAGGVAHDFNNLLTIIGGQAEILSAELEDSELRPLVEEISASVDRSSELTGQLLAFSRKQQVRPVRLDLNDVVASVLTMVRRLIGEDILVRFAPAHAPALAMFDRGQFEQVVLNLCTNARDAMPQGGQIEISLTVPRVESDHFVRMQITDSGSGIDAETQKHIFEPFFTTKPTGSGTGLGLSTVYGIVQQHDGSISVQSELGKGTTFEIVLPYSPGAAADDETIVGLEPDEADGGGARVLVVEDEDKVREIVTRMLSRSGYHVTDAPSGAAALELARASMQGWDLLLSDVRMPDQSGPELARELIRIGSVSRVLFMSGYAENSPDLSDLSGVEWGFLPKPFAGRDLREAVGELIRRGGRDEVPL